ncbi:histone deacetylase family protein [Hwanghaeella grinnelliae]|uniref:Histone deacetylase family protein n=1 Tax=Hwanghaeella grinnelliae TaxID=2500179 RepID=A0A3S2WQ34_9PROT|nr:histone deacetylase family protein [Hwanghaeella grinnelliae]RVU34738.1 histone deacetylase family protein [Hwanghaeella grinnelliae]
MTTALFWHPSCREHNMGAGHPEQPARLDSVLVALEADAFEDLERVEAPRATREQILRCHPASHLDDILGSVPENGIVQLDADTSLSPGSGEAALRAAGAAVAAVDAVMTGKYQNAFCAVRPPGHHAEPQHPMGFCLFNNIAIGAEHAVAAHKADRVAVVDFDVHHGNGTQAMFARKPNMFFASSHQMPLYPGTGQESERGVAGNIVNVALPPNAGGEEFRIAFEVRILPALRDFKPNLLMISAGFDAHRDDPLANLNLVEDDYHWATSELAALADELCEGRIVSTLEGGYDLGALGRSAAAHVRALMEA